MKMKKRFLSVLLSLVMVLGLMPGVSLTALAATEQSEMIATTAATVNGNHFTISNNNFADGTYGMSAYSSNGGITVTPKNNEYITKVIITCDWQSGAVSDTSTTVSSGTKTITDGGGTITVTNVNASTFNFKCTYSYPLFNQFVVYYLDSAPTIAVTGVILDKTSATLTVDGEVVALTATVSPDGATDKTVKWSTTGDVTLYTDQACTAGKEVGADATETLTVYAKPISAGFATVTVTSNADGSKSATCAVTVNKGNPTAPTGLTATYGQTLANVTLPDGWTWADSTQSVGNVVDPAATFKANFAGNDNYNAASNVDVTVTVGKADPTAPTGLTATYGQTLANVTLPTGWTWADSTQSVGNVVDPAATFKANFAGDDNHNAASNVDVTVTVGKADPTAPTGLTATYGQTLANVTLPTGWTWADSTQSVGNVVDPAATFKANFAGDDNHNAASNVDVAVTVSKADAVAATVTANDRTYDGTEQPLVTVTGEATGGEMQYALGTASEATEAYSTAIPTATEAGT